MGFGHVLPSTNGSEIRTSITFGPVNFRSVCLALQCTLCRGKKRSSRFEDKRWVSFLNPAYILYVNCGSWFEESHGS